MTSEPTEHEANELRREKSHASLKEVGRLEFEQMQLRRLGAYYFNSDAYIGVHKWLAPVAVCETFHKYERSREDAHADFEKILTLAVGALRHSPKFQKTLEDISLFVSAQMTDHHLVLHRHHRRHNVSLSQTYISAIYARMLHTLRHSWFGTPESAPELARWVIGDNVDNTVEHIQARLRELGPHFIGLLTTEAEKRAAADPDFNDALRRAYAVYVDSLRGTGDVNALLASAERHPETRPLSEVPLSEAASLRLHLAFVFTLWD